MLVYVVVFVVVIAFLLWAFRSMGAATLEPKAPQVTTQAVREIIAAAAEQIASMLPVGEVATARGGYSRSAISDSEQQEHAAATRKKLGGYTQLLDDIDDVDERERLARALQCIAWAARMCESENFAANPPLQEAAQLLVAGARAGLEGD